MRLRRTSRGSRKGHTNMLTPFAGIKSKVENNEQYKQYLDELEPLRKELGVPLKEDLYPEAKEDH